MRTTTIAVTRIDPESPPDRSGYPDRVRNRAWNATRRGRLDTKTDKFREYRKKWALRKRYQMSPEDYARMLSTQGGVCAICSEPPNGTALSVDHCHKRDVVRGLLCNKCNVGLSNFLDDPKLLSLAQRYICRAALKAVGQ